MNSLWEYFNQHDEGPGIWKWEHYFPVYQRHFEKFINKQVKILEIGIYSGGSLNMWKRYFGKDCHIIGVDIEIECEAYESEDVTVFIGDQEDPAFWDDFVRRVPEIDILIDDGGHTAEQQMVTLEKMLPHIRPGGVYLCEDVHGISNRFTEFAAGLVRASNSFATPNDPTPFQADINSIHFYPFVVVIEKRSSKLTHLIAPKRGTQWQPFLDE